MSGPMCQCLIKKARLAGLGRAGTPRPYHLAFIFLKGEK